MHYETILAINLTLIYSNLSQLQEFEELIDIKQKENYKEQRE